MSSNIREKNIKGTWMSSVSFYALKSSNCAFWLTNFAWHVRYWRYNSFNFCRALSLENLIAAQRGCTSRSLSISASHFALFFGYFKQRVRICSIRHLCIKLFNFWFHLLCQAVYFVFSSLWHPFHPIKLTKVRVHFKERGRSDILLLTWFVWFR